MPVLGGKGVPGYLICVSDELDERELGEVVLHRIEFSSEVLVNGRLELVYTFLIQRCPLPSPAVVLEPYVIVTCLLHRRRRSYCSQESTCSF